MDPLFWSAEAISKTKAKQSNISEVDSLVITWRTVKFSKTLFICEGLGN